MAFLTDRKRALGTGSGRAGTHHMRQMMGTSIALVFLVPLFVFTLGGALGGTFDEVRAYYGQPFPAIVAALMIVVGITHLKNEVLEAIEDYVHGTAGTLAMFAVRGVSTTMIVVGLYAIAKLAL